MNRSPVPLVPRRGWSRISASVDAPGQADLSQMARVSTVFAIVDGIASEVAAATWRLFRGDSLEDPDRVEVTRHPALSVWERPNPHFSRATLVEATQQHYELSGEFWWVLASDSEVNGKRVRSPWPLEIWPVRPDRMTPVRDATRFVTGYLHTLAGEETPLGADQVIFGRRPNPLTPYRGLSPLGSLVYDLEGEQAAAQYNYSFFKNGAFPGGIITAEDPLADDDFDQLMRRWREQHRGSSNAHRVGYLEGRVKFEAQQYTRRDMEFVDLRGFSKETIREAWRFPRSMMGSESASNRATHEAEHVVFAQRLITPRLRRIREALNNEFLPLFQGGGRNSTSRLFFDFDDPTPVDAESTRKDLEVSLKAAETYIDLGFDEAETLEAFGLPEVTFKERPVARVSTRQAAPAAEGPATDDDQESGDDE